jgi:gliding motility associated protien GldN
MLMLRYNIGNAITTNHFSSFFKVFRIMTQIIGLFSSRCTSRFAAALAFALMANFALAQSVETNVTESGKPSEAQPNVEPINDSPYERKLFKEKKVLANDHIREADVFYEKRMWRVIDVREKINQPFMYPKAPFLSVLLNAATNGEITVYSTSSGDDFKIPIDKKELTSIISSVDTVMAYDPVTYDATETIVVNELNYEDVKRFRVKEVWFFDKESGTMQCRILGIAPIKEVKDDKGNFRYEQPMFWVYYPHLREVLARTEAFNPLNDAQRMTWEDIFEMRLFSSYITKESNVHNRRIEDYKTGTDALLEGSNIKNTVFNFEHDLWSY